MINLLLALQLSAFAAAAVPAILRLRRFRNSRAMSTWRETLLLGGILCQLGIMFQTHVRWQVWIGPCLSFASIAVLLAHVYFYRRAGLL